MSRFGGGGGGGGGAGGGGGPPPRVVEGKRRKFKGHIFLQFHHIFVPISMVVKLIFPVAP